MRLGSVFAVSVMFSCFVACGGAPDSSVDGADEAAAEEELRSSVLSCAPVPACDAKAPTPKVEGFEHVSSELASTLRASHRGRDVLVTRGQRATVVAKFAYGTGAEKSLIDERVHVYLEQGCGGAWTDLGVQRTSTAGQHAYVEGVEDDGDRVYVTLPALPIGRHRVHFVALGDGTSTDAFVEVLAPNAKIIVSDVDGTLTTSENAEFGSLLTGDLSQANPHAAEALRTAVAKGYRPFYLTARPEWLVGRTREFLAARGFPVGVVRTTTYTLGAANDLAAAFKLDELEALAPKKIRPWFAVGNRASDATAFTAGSVPPSRAFLYQFTDEISGCVRIDDYADLVKKLQALPACK